MAWGAGSGIHLTAFSMDRSRPTGFSVWEFIECILLEASTNQLGCVARVYPKPQPTEITCWKGFQWVCFIARETDTPEYNSYSVL